MSRTLREAAQMALDALLIGYHRGTHDAIAALRSALDAPEPEPEPWREAVLDRLAVLSMDAAQDEPPASILRRIIEAEVAIALDPRVSDAAPAVPLTDKQILSMWRASKFRGNGGQADWFCEGIRAAERAHNIGGSK